MSEVHLDRRGTPIKVGAKVCYNQSGTVAYGELTDITQRMQYGRTRWTFHVRNLMGNTGRSYSPLNSKVSHAENLMVLTPDMLP